jgi:hypothetical protein
MLERRTKRMPAKAARSSTRGRPPLGLAGSAGRSGSTAAHRALATRGLAMPNQRTHSGFVRRSKCGKGSRSLELSGSGVTCSSIYSRHCPEVPEVKAA